MARQSRPARKAPASEGTTVLGARVKQSVFDLVDVAARIRGLDRSEVVVNGATKEAFRIIEIALREIRRHKERQRRARAAARRLQRKDKP
jgi:uncharacterized protein (DUF1778 family)